jgi:septum formation protein
MAAAVAMFLCPQAYFHRSPLSKRFFGLRPKPRRAAPGARWTSLLFQEYRLPMPPLFEQLRPLALASSSPRRQAFLREQGLEFRIVVPAAEEPDPLPGEAAEAYALRMAGIKARNALALLGAEADAPLVLAADTVVTLEDGNSPAILGKPDSAEHALSMLRRLAGRTHTVITACCLASRNGEPCCFADLSRVVLAPWTDEILRAYAATGDPMDKAGSYGIQGKGAFLVDRVEGSWSTVAGLPVSRVMAALLQLGAVRPFPA